MKTQHYSFLLIWLFFLPFFLHGQENSTQLVQLIPKETFVGTQSVIKYTTQNQRNLLFPSTIFTPHTHVELFQRVMSQLQEDNKTESKFTLTSIQVQHKADTIIVLIEFIPWETGEIDIPPFDIGIFSQNTDKSLFINIPAINVASILTKTGKTALQPMMPPLVIPGTSYMILFVILLIVITIVGIIISILRFNIIFTWIMILVRELEHTFNLKKSLKSMNRLYKKECTDSHFCTELSLHIKNYLEKRFGLPFSTHTSTEITSLFYTLFQDLAPEHTHAAIQSISALCIHCDYIHFSYHSQEKEMTQINRREFIDNAHLALLTLEQKEAQNKC